MDKVKLVQSPLENTTWSLVGKEQGRFVTNQIVQNPTTLSLFSCGLNTTKRLRAMVALVFLCLLFKLFTNV